MIVKLTQNITVDTVKLSVQFKERRYQLEPDLPDRWSTILPATQQQLLFRFIKDENAIFGYRLEMLTVGPPSIGAAWLAACSQAGISPLPPAAPPRN